GYGACWVGFKRWNTFGGKFIDPAVYEKFYKHFGLEKDKVPVSLIAVGRPALIPKAPPRQGLEQIIISEPRRA
ncbi:MAG: hypothetical protein KAX19_08935, partial [Candidatus Brocadiae bacterium]|nr:hypothetical protein [Candidatus Brocadiia bacterium]